ncbi:hypothetical protein ACFQL1_13100 [Halomicroarcula sp. GCM10025709]|uniref:hypothetical protein n=1 Tax=Halomicroarcula sp. GCM10025709 TaxID=3252669 RepID=UPI0036099102
MSRRALALVAALALASVVMLVPTGAAPFTQSGTDAINDEVHLAPAEGDNGKYAVLNEEGEIELLLSESNPYADADGVKEDATTRIGNVFTITYTGSDQAKVWLTDDAEDVRFYRSGGAAGSLEREANAVVLGPNMTVHVGLRIDTRGEHDVDQADSFTVHAETPDGSTPPPTETATPEPIPTPEPTATPEPTPVPTSVPERVDDDDDDTDRTDRREPTPTATPDPSDDSTPIATPSRPSENGDDGDGSTPTPRQPARRPRRPTAASPRRWAGQTAGPRRRRGTRRRPPVGP